MRCIICHTQKQSSAFQDNGPICQSCVKRLSSEYDVDYSPPERVTRLEAFIKLLVASRDLAVEDGALDEWEETFLLSKEWQTVWMLLKRDEIFY